MLPCALARREASPAGAGRARCRLWERHAESPLPPQGHYSDGSPTDLFHVDAPPHCDREPLRLKCPQACMEMPWPPTTPLNSSGHLALLGVRFLRERRCFRHK